MISENENLHRVVEEHHAFYEVAPYYVVLEERHPGLAATTQRIQAGFDIDIYGVTTRNQLRPPGTDPDYVLGCAELQKIAEEVSHQTSDYSAVKVIPFPSTAIVDTQNHGNVEGTVRIRICHYRGLDQPFGPQEQRALEEVEKQLKSIGVARR